MLRHQLTRNAELEDELAAARLEARDNRAKKHGGAKAIQDVSADCGNHDANSEAPVVGWGNVTASSGLDRSKKEMTASILASCKLLCTYFSENWCDACGMSLPSLDLTQQLT